MMPPVLADERQPNEAPVASVGGYRLDLGPDGVLPVALSEGWDAPDISAALVVLHGRLRNPSDYLRAGVAAVGNRPGWMVAVPQFLADVDIAAHALPPRTLRWTLTGWMGGDPATDPAPLSAFAAIDGVLAFLQRRPVIRRVILVGHSGGGQVVQRYAMLGDTPAGLRFVVANPSSYAFLGPERPESPCPGHDDWKYGLSSLPRYAGSATRDDLAQRYAERDVRYLLGAEDTDPAHPALDRSPAAKCQGPHRRARGEAFHADLLRRFPDCRHPLRIVPGVGHDGGAMLGSAEGAAALFE